VLAWLQEKRPTVNITSIGRWDIKAPQEWDLVTSESGVVSCSTEQIPPGRDGSPPTFGSWGAHSHGRLSHKVTVLIQTCSKIHTITYGIKRV
jgi:hypothetical protein